MKTDKNILIAFILNLIFSIFEFFGGIITGSVAISADAIHDLGDATTIGFSFFLERKSKKAPDKKYTYGYSRFSVLGSVITSLLLLVGAIVVIIGAVYRIFVPVSIDYDKMIIFAVIGVIVNLVAARATHGGSSLNQKAVNLHMLEDVLGWLSVLIGAIIMKFTDLSILDPILSLAVSVFIIVNATKNLYSSVVIFLEKAPHHINIDELCKEITSIDGVSAVHHVHLWSLDESNVLMSAHIVSDQDNETIKGETKKLLESRGISHSTLEFENKGKVCSAPCCRINNHNDSHHHHHHHHH